MMSESTIQIPPKNGGLLVADPQTVLEKCYQFPGAAAVVRLLQPYYQKAVEAAHPESGSHAQNVSRVPETHLKEARQNLTALQSSAIQARVSGDTSLADEILEVAHCLGSMMLTIEQMQNVAKPVLSVREVS